MLMHLPRGASHTSALFLATWMAYDFGAYYFILSSGTEWHLEAWTLKTHRVKWPKKYNNPGTF